MREFPVFGVLEGMFLSGIVDDLRRSDCGELALSDLKTRVHNSFPCPSQARGHFLQVAYMSQNKLILSCFSQISQS